MSLFEIKNSLFIYACNPDEAMKTYERIAKDSSEVKLHQVKQVIEFKDKPIEHGARAVVGHSLR